MQYLVRDHLENKNAVSRRHGAWLNQPGTNDKTGPKRKRKAALTPEYTLSRRLTQAWIIFINQWPPVGDEDASGSLSYPSKCTRAEEGLGGRRLRRAILQN